MLSSLTIRELNEAASIALQDLLPSQIETTITADTPYLTITECTRFLKLYNLQIRKVQFRQYLSWPSTSLIPPLQSILAADVPQLWCITIPNQKSRDGLIHIIPTTYLSPTSQLLAKRHGYGHSFTERLSPNAQIIFTLLRKQSDVTYDTAAQHCGDHLSRSTFFHIKKRLLSQERYFPWKQSSSHCV